MKSRKKKKPQNPLSKKRTQKRAGKFALPKLAEVIPYWNGRKTLPVLSLKVTPDDPKPFWFGVRKAQLILEHVPEIEAFVERYGR